MGIRNFATCHSHPNSLDSASTPEAFAKREVELETGVITVTDHGTLQACRKIYDLGKKNKLIPVLGMEGYLRDDNCPILLANGYQKNSNGAFTNAPKYMHVTLHFLDQAAYECGVRLLSRADGRLEDTLAKLEPKDRKHGKERKPLFTWADLEELGSYNTTMTTGCMIGLVQRHLMENNDLRTATAYFDKLQTIVKPGNLYTELNPHDTSKNWVEGVFLTMKDGTKLQFYAEKWLMTNVGEIRAKDLAKVWAKNDHRVLKSVKDRTKWREMPEVEITSVEHIEGYMPNDPCSWAPNGDLQAGLNRAMRYLAKQRNVPILIGDDSHYALAEESVVQDVRLAQEGPWRFYGKYHRKSSQEAFQHFRKTLGTQQTEFEGWVENSHEWAARFKDFVFNTPVSLPTKFYEAEYEKKPWFKPGNADNSLRYTMDLIKKHGRMDWKNQAMVDRLKEEIQLLHFNGTIDLLPYFMVDEEVCSLYEDNGLLTGPGRGSAAGLILTYLLGITHVDPLKFKLSLERFITQDRIASGGLPDIDQDLPHRELLVDPENGWLKKRFGDCYAQISVDSTLKLKMAVKDVSRSMRGQVPPEIEVLTKKFAMPPQNVNDFDFVMGHEVDGEGWVDGSKEYDPALKAYISKYPEDWKVVQKALGLTRQKGRHACAYVIANRPISEFIPLTTISNVRVTSYTANSVESVGGLKMDFLVINSLNDISDCIKMVQEHFYGDGHGVIFDDTIIDGKRVPKHRLVPRFDDESYQIYDIWDLPEDQDVFADVALGKTETVFQFNTPGAVQWLSHFAYKKPNGNYAIDSIEAMSAFTALDRPGALNVILRNPDRDGDTHNALVEFARRSRGENPSPDVLAVFDELIPETHGVMVYQEQLQHMYQQLTGCTGPEAEQFRKDVAKKKVDKIQKAYNPFIEKAGARIGVENAKAAWEFFITWAKYGFNKSHSVCYAVIGYACAYLKHHFPLQWWTSVLRNAAKNEVSDKFWRYCGGLIDLPDVKLSGPNFEIQGKRIRAPLSLLQGVGEAAAKQLKDYAPYTDVNDFCAKIDEHQKKTGTWEEKVKIKKVREVVEGSKKKVTREVEVKEMVLKRGYNALNRGVVQHLILSGSMDSLFPESMHVGEQLNAYEDALHLATGCKREPVKQELWDIGPVRRYQMRKSILPAYGCDLVPLVQEHFNRDPYSDEPQLEWTPPNSTTGRQLTLSVATAKDIDHWSVAPLPNDESITCAVAAYVEECELRTFGDEHKEMCKIRLDVDGARFEFVQWPSKDTKQVAEIYRQPLKGAVVIAVLNKWRQDKPFALQDLRVVEPPMKTKTKEKEGTNEQASNA